MTQICKKCGLTKNIHGLSVLDCDKFEGENELLKRGRQLGTKDSNTIQMLKKPRKGCGKIIKINKDNSKSICGTTRTLLCFRCKKPQNHSPIKEPEDTPSSACSEEGTFNLSEKFKEEYDRYVGKDTEAWSVVRRLEVDVKTFIKKLKEELWACKSPAKETMEIIDKLAGEELR